MTNPETDWLTGLPSHRAFLKAVEASSQDGPHALLMLDVDRLAYYNYEFRCPEVGDYALRGLSELLLRHTRVADLAARYGGDEFVLLLPQTTLNQAELIAERIHADVASFAWPSQSPVISSAGYVWPNQAPTVSIGVAPLGLEGWQSMVAASEEAVREAKLAGGNCVRVAR